MLVTLTVSLSEVIRLLLSLTILTQYPEKKNLSAYQITSNILYWLISKKIHSSRKGESFMRSLEFEGLNQLYLCSRCTLDSCLTNRSNIALKKKKMLSLSGPRVRFSKVLVTLWPRKAVLIFIPDGGFKGFENPTK